MDARGMLQLQGKIGSSDFAILCAGIARHLRTLMKLKV